MNTQSDLPEQRKENGMPDDAIAQPGKVTSEACEGDETILDLLRRAQAELPPEERQSAIDIAEQVLRSRQ